MIFHVWVGGGGLGSDLSPRSLLSSHIHTLFSVFAKKVQSPPESRFLAFTQHTAL